MFSRHKEIPVTTLKRRNLYELKRSQQLSGAFNRRKSSTKDPLSSYIHRRFVPKKGNIDSTGSGWNNGMKNGMKTL